MKEPADKEKHKLSTKNNMKIMKKKSRINLPDFEVSPHTERIIKENKRLISVYTKSKA
ncbi:type II toxin-antitoxin system SpoIISB family antitoxin [Bacillus sp. CMF12]|uniref:type II toxin-antitoxin system SpoIISB family antitoxin n=1 Tax=Bacillaceae TaxID=186817 RepID=UPI001FB46A4C|nr:MULTISPECIES: type II toxin-antitoxin system SpoIISB family antitoxin [Bacillaceae]MDF2035802.1 type II toxin-antitoxin system SpoIISB family antitoxin [Cytobacillus oceanisediminis]UOE53110.1 type II toxin-antitoxin system SpoIISB family antitoxin [Cytobacillus oceanisediminis]USK52318.1 type II toxin-antitoxin system SpoIISB family antitoxin [Bacillus sp. CMF12]